MSNPLIPSDAKIVSRSNRDKHSLWMTKLDEDGDEETVLVFNCASQIQRNMLHRAFQHGGSDEGVRMALRCVMNEVKSRRQPRDHLGARGRLQEDRALLGGTR